LYEIKGGALRKGQPAKLLRHKDIQGAKFSEISPKAAVPAKFNTAGIMCESRGEPNGEGADQREVRTRFQRTSARSFTVQATLRDSSRKCSSAQRMAANRQRRSYSSMATESPAK
jgi:hypothetical protein